MKILVIVPYFNEPHRWMVSGQKTAYELAKHHQVVVVSTGKETTVEQDGKNLKIYRLKDYFLKDPINFSIVPVLFRQIREIVQKETPDAALINKHMFYTSLAVWPLKQLGLPVVIQTDTFPGINWFPRNPLVRVVMWLYARLIGNPVLRKADSVVLLHEGLLPVAKNIGIRAQVIHNGVDLEQLERSKPPADLRKKKGEIWIGYVGRLESIKGWYDLADVGLEMVKTNPNIKVLFIGANGNATEQMAKYQHPQMLFLGQRKDVLGIYKLLDIFVLPSYSEGLPNALMEAMASRIACVASDTGGIKELIVHNKNGLLFPPGNHKKLRDCLERSLNSTLRQKFAKAARQKIEDSYQLSKAVAVLAKLLTPRRSSR